MNEQNGIKQTQVTPETQSNRRDFLRWSATGIVLGLPLLRAIASKAAEVAAPVVIQPAMPVVDARFPSEIADGIWVIADKRIPLVPNIGIVEGDKTVLVIDSGFTSQSGRNVLEAARAIAGKRDIVLTITHAHPEHTFGAQAFKGRAHIYYNKLQRDYLARDGQKLLKGFRPFLPADRVSLLDDIHITLADEVYSGSQASLDLGNRKVEFRTWGIAHSPGDQIITVPDQKVTFAGDLIEERMFPIVPLFPPMIQATDIDLRTWETALTQMVAQQPRIIVPGHGNLGGVEIANNVRGYFGEIRGLVASFKAKKVADADAVRQLEAVVQKRHPTWERNEFIAPALRYLVAKT
jgi:glyoxylase-like metal-dependent hydrolase (beta-lactamase superfamily II)